MRASIVWGMVACCLVFASGASAEVLVEQRPGPAATGVPSQGPGGKPSGTQLAADDVLVPAGEHWSLSAIHPFGTRADGTYDVTVYDGASVYDADTGSSTGIPGNPDFQESVAAAPDGTIPITGAPLLREGGYWISVSSRSNATEPWGWLTSAAGAGYPANWVAPSDEPVGCGDYLWAERRKCLPATASEPDQAFVLEGTRMQTLVATSYGEQGLIVSSPPGIACPPTCNAVFPRGTAVSLTGSPLRANMEFVYWHVGGGFPSSTPSPAPGIPGGPPSLAEITDPRNAGPVPCAPGPDGATAALTNPCRLTLSSDVYVNGIFRTNDFEVGKLKLKRNLRAGTAKLLLRLPASGSLSVGGAGVRPWEARQPAHGTERVPIVARGAAAARLRHSGRAKVGLRFTYTAFDRKPATTVRHVTLLRRLPR